MKRPASQDQPAARTALLALLIAGCAHTQTKPSSAPSEATAPELAASAKTTSLKNNQQLTDVWGDRFTRWLYAAKVKKLHRSFSPQMKAALSLEKLEAFQRGLATEMGKEVAVVSKAHSVLPTVAIYRRVVRFAKHDKEMEVCWTLRGLPGRPVIAGLYVRSPIRAAATKRSNYQTKNTLRLPFRGTWYVFWGGRTVAQNYHARARDQRFAYDLAIVRDGKSHRGNGTRNEQYYCFGKPVLAATSGKVVAAENSHKDQEPGVRAKTAPLGNHVIIDQGHGEFAFYCHLKQGSVGVRVGDAVEAGQPIGQCGNSGRSSEAHLHFHVQDTPIPFKGLGIPMQFQGYRADGKAVPRGEPLQGQLVEQHD